MYKVVADFRDLKDNERLYKVGDEYPAADAPKPTKARIKELVEGKNHLERVFIEEILETPTAPAEENESKE
jgi:hypothetical protein